MRARVPLVFISFTLLAWMAVSGSAARPLEQAPVPDAARRVVYLSLDGAADWITDKWIAEGRAPAFQRMQREGAAADSMVATLPSLTAVAHATLWTGASPRVHGISGNWMPAQPAAQHTILEQQSGYLRTPLRAEPIWAAAARAGRRALVLQASHGVPFERGFTSQELLQFDVYANQLARPEIVEGSLGSEPFVLQVGDAELRVARRRTTGGVAAGGPTGAATETPDEALEVGDAHASSLLRPAPGSRWSGVFRTSMDGRAGAYRVGLLDWQPDTGRFTLVRGRVSLLVASDAAELDRFAASAGTITEAGITLWFKQGRFGVPLADGGGGAAEDALAEAIEVNHEFFERSLEYAAGRPWDLLVCYSSSLDLAHHALVGMLDPASSAYRSDIAAQVWPVAARIFQRVADGYVASIRRRFPDAALIVTSDHGMEGAGRAFYPNVILERAGLLARQPDGAIDLARTKAYYADGRGGIITLNTANWRGGTVTPAERDQVSRAVTKALLAARDPDTGAPLVRAVFDSARDGEALGFGGPGVDLVFDPAVDYAPSARPRAAVAAESLGPLGEGEHGAAPWRRKLHGIFYAAGPGIRPGTALPIVDATNIAPTVARLLGIPAPAQSTGRPLDIFEKPDSTR